MSRLKLRICCHWSKPSTLTIVSTLSHFADWCKNINHLNIPDTPNEWRIPRKYVWSEIIYECFISKAPYWILESVYCSFHFDLIKAWRFWFQIYDSNRSFVFRKLKGMALLCIRDNESYKSESLQLVRSFIKKCFMQYQIYTIFLVRPYMYIVASWPYMSDVCYESEVRGVKWSLNRISNESFNKISQVECRSYSIFTY